MKKYLAIFILAMLLSSCAFTGNDISELPVPTGTANENKIDVSPSPAKATEPTVVSRVLTPEKELVYRNEIAGYQLTFPEHWRGYYVVTEYSNAAATIGFYGKSKTSQIGDKRYTTRDGLDMFWIATNPYPDMNGRKIGEINGVGYFFVSFGGIPSILSGILDPDSSVREFVKYEVDETELELAAQDWEKAKKMYEDIDDVLETFKTIE